MTSKSLTGKRILYTLCFVGFCIIDQIKGSATGRVQMTAVNCMGFLMAAIILSAYHWKDFLKLPYYIWTGIFVVGGVAAYLWGKTNYPYQGRWITAILNVGIYGYILIRLWYKFVVDKEKLQVNKVLFAIWCIMLLCMLFSRNEAIWPLWFLVMFGSFYVTDYRPEVRKVLFDSMIDGLIVGFFLIQGAAFLFRPYDTLRYLGMYANSNINVLFYAVTYCAWLCKWYQLKCRKAPIFWRGVVAFFAGAMFGFAFLTIGRDGLLTMAVVTLCFLVYCAATLGKNKFRTFLGNGIIIAVVAVVSFPLVFGCVRYIPAYVHHPIWFEGEYSDAKVQSGDPVDSEKYIGWSQILRESFGRVLWFVDFSKEQARAFFQPSMVVQAASLEDGAAGQIQENKMNIDSSVSLGTDKQHPVLSESPHNPLVIRTSIYKYYLKRLNFRGHHQNENGFWLLKDYYAPHAHNLIIQMAFNFGVLPAVFFALIGLYMLWTVVQCHKCIIQMEEKTQLCIMLIYLILLFVFGMFELDWEVGQNSFTCYTFVASLLMRSNLLFPKACDRINKIVQK